LPKPTKPCHSEDSPTCHSEETGGLCHSEERHGIDERESLEVTGTNTDPSLSLRMTTLGGRDIAQVT
jgi:hypothetical protein